MARKPYKLRSAVLGITSIAVGGTVGALAEVSAARLGLGQPGIGQVVTAVVALWTIDKLDRLVDER